MKKTYVIVKCEELSDQWECDADKTPIRVLINVEPNKLEEFKCYGYEVYVASADGTLEKIQDYNSYVCDGTVEDDEDDEW